jgi:hypothetical protein
MISGYPLSQAKPMANASVREGAQLFFVYSVPATAVLPSARGAAKAYPFGAMTCMERSTSLQLPLKRGQIHKSDTWLVHTLLDLRNTLDKTHPLDPARKVPSA